MNKPIQTGGSRIRLPKPTVYETAEEARIEADRFIEDLRKMIVERKRCPAMIVAFGIPYQGASDFIAMAMVNGSSFFLGPLAEIATAAANAIRQKEAEENGRRN